MWEKTGAVPLLEDDGEEAPYNGGGQLQPEYGKSQGGRLFLQERQLALWIVGLVCGEGGEGSVIKCENKCRWISAGFYEQRMRCLLRGGRYDGKGKLFLVILHTKKTGWGCHPFCRRLHCWKGCGGGGERIPSSF